MTDLDGVPDGLDHLFTPYITITSTLDGTEPQLLSVEWDDSYRSSCEFELHEGLHHDLDGIPEQSQEARAVTEWFDTTTAALSEAITAVLRMVPVPDDGLVSLGTGQAAVIAELDNSTVQFVQDTMALVANDDWYPGDDVDRDGTVRSIVLALAMGTADRHSVPAGDLWNDYPDLLSDWRYEVANGDTLRSFREFIEERAEMAAEEDA